VIKGWDFGCLGMKLGETRRLSIPAEEGYGAGGFPAWGIPPNGSLDFEIEVSLPGTLRCAALLRHACLRTRVITQPLCVVADAVHILGISGAM
jgi:hypothetical protein